jgi:hypothetical protein
MNYPKRSKKILTFSRGGGMTSLFDNPGTYLGIQYIPTQPDLPDVEGLQYMMQQEQASRLAMEEKAKKSRPDLGALSEALKGVDGLTGETMQVYQGIENKINKWTKKYDTPEKMISSEAISESARIMREVQMQAVALKNNKEYFKEQKTASKDVSGNVYFNNGLMYINDPETGRARGIGMDEWLEKKDADLKGSRPLTVNEIHRYKQDRAGFGELDYDINQYSTKERDEYLRGHFAKIGSNTTSFEGGPQFGAMLENVGIDPKNIDMEKFKYSIKDGTVNANMIYDVMAKSLDSRARNSIVANMIENGVDLNERFVVGKDKDGKDVTVDAVSAQIHELLTGEIAKSLNNTQDISITPTDKDGDGDGSGDGSGEATRLQVLLDPKVPLSMLVQQYGLRTKAGEKMVYSPHHPEPLHDVPVISYAGLTEDELEGLVGRKSKIGNIDEDRRVYFNGQDAILTTANSSAPTQKRSKIMWLPKLGNLNVWEVPDPSNKNENQKLGAVEAYVIVDKAGLDNFLDNDGNPLDKNAANKERTGLIEKITADQLENMLVIQGVNADAAKTMAHKTDWDGRGTWVSNQHMYKLKVDIPVDDLSLYYDDKATTSKKSLGSSQSKAHKHIEQINANIEQAKKVNTSMNAFYNAQ